MSAHTPTAAPQTLRYGIGETRIGFKLVGLSNAGVATVLVAADKATLRRELAAAFSTSELIEDQEGAAEAMSTVVRAIDDPGRPVELKLDVRGSPAELAVWEALRAIPAGQTRTYGQIAKSVSILMTAQEVGAACAANVLAILIPCHRVIKADGLISGYRWGVSRKRQLLEMEAVR